MKIWIMNHYASDMFFAEGGRHYYFAKYLKRLGHEPTIFCANTKHNAREVTYFDFDGLWTEKINLETLVPYVFVKARPYGTNGKDRILNMVDFYRNVIKVGRNYCAENGKPDIIVASSVHPLTLLAGIKLAKIFKIKCICEVRDLWPESIVTYLSGYKRNNPLIRLLYHGEKYIYKKADSIIFTMEGGYDYISEKGWSAIIPQKKVFHINNGVDLEQFRRNKEDYRWVDEDLENDKLFKVVYSGSIRKVNNLDILLDVAKHIRDERILFLIWGDGDELPKLKNRIHNERITNVVFKGRVDKKYIPYITSKADLNFAHNGESELFRFGISFNKIFDYLAACKPILCDFNARYNPVISYSAGEFYSSTSIQEIVGGIEWFSRLDDGEYSKYCKNALTAAEYYDFKNLTDELIKVIEVTNKMGV